MSLGLTARATLFALACASPAAVFALPAPGSYFFNGSCMDCPPAPSPAAAALLVPTDDISQASFGFVSSNFNLLSEWIEVANLGPINAQGHADAWILFGSNNKTWDFRSDTSGDWSLTDQSIPADYGDQGVWTTRPIPEPATYGLLGLGLIGLAMRRRAATH